MKLTVICLVMSVACLAAGDGGLLKAKARLFGKLGRHNKRGVLGSVPTYKLGHDIPHVTHSLVKPLVVTYPPAATVTTVKVPFSHPLIPRHPHGHASAPHPHFGLKYPHNKLVPRPDQHFHHHHHHLAPRPVVPVVPAPPVPLPVPAPVPATPLVPVAQPTAPIPQPLPPPLPFAIHPQFAFHPAPLFPGHAVPASPPPVPVFPHHPPHVSPILPAAAVPLRPAPVFPAFPAPPVQYAPQLQYVLRPGNSIQTSVFATYPRYPLPSYRPLVPLAAPPLAPAAVAPVPHPQVLFEQPHFPHFHVAPGQVLHQGPTVAPTPTIVHETHAAPQPALHVHPTQQVALENDGWAPVPAHPHDVQLQDSHHHYPQEPYPQFAQEGHHFTQEQGTQVYEHHTGDEQQYHDQQYHDLQHQIQHQLEQAQFEQHLNNQHQLNDQHQLNQEYGAPQLNQEYGQPNGEYSHQDGHGQDFSQHQDFNYQQPGSEYGTPGVEGRSGEAEEEELKFHNHIPLGLQPPIDRPLEHFR